MTHKEIKFLQKLINAHLLSWYSVQAYYIDLYDRFIIYFPRRSQKGQDRIDRDKEY